MLPTPVRKPPTTGSSTGPVGFSSSNGFGISPGANEPDEAELVLDPPAAPAPELPDVEVPALLEAFDDELPDWSVDVSVEVLEEVPEEFWLAESELDSLCELFCDPFCEPLPFEL